MKCIILAAGRGERMMPFTSRTPKPLLEVRGKALIDYVLESLPKGVDEIIIVVKYLGWQIKKHVGKKAKYVTGSDKGNAYSFLNTRKCFDLEKGERFLLIYGDEMPSMENVKRCLSKKLSILVYKPSFFKPYVKDGVMVLNTDIFENIPLLTGSVQFSVMVDWFMQDHKVAKVKAKNFIGEINTPEDYIKLNLWRK
jgi:NDP-sugar pyrophosphorylase family protein